MSSMNSKTEIVLNNYLEKMLMVLQSISPAPRGCNVSYVELWIPHTKLLPSVVQALILELKPLPDHLNYDYLGDTETLSVITSMNLTTVQEEKLIRVLETIR